MTAVHTSIEDDVERVRRVTEKMSGPRTVWVLHNDDSRHGNQTWVYASESLARDAWKHELSYYTDPRAQDWYAEIDSGVLSFEMWEGAGDWWELSEEIILDEVFKR